jgi:hypothetical protein
MTRESDASDNRRVHRRSARGCGGRAEMQMMLSDSEAEVGVFGAGREEDAEARGGDARRRRTLSDTQGANRVSTRRRRRSSSGCSARGLSGRLSTYISIASRHVTTTRRDAQRRGGRAQELSDAEARGCTRRARADGRERRAEEGERSHGAEHHGHANLILELPLQDGVDGRRGRGAK